jgi:hypothetical protein
MTPKDEFDWWSHFDLQIFKLLGFEIELSESTNNHLYYSANTRINGMIFRPYVEELYKLIKEDILRLVQQVIKDIAKERIVKKYAMILKLLALLLAIIGLITDYRKCKNLIDDILALLNLLNVPGFGSSIPLPILYVLIKSNLNKTIKNIVFSQPYLYIFP